MRLLRKLVEWIMAKMEKHNMIPEGEQDVYAYSLEVVLGSAMFWLMMILLTIAFGEVGATMIYLIVFFLFRSSIGGYHASTHLRCISISAIAYLIFIWCYNQFASQTILTLVFSILAIVIVFIFAPIDHPNKPFSRAEWQRYRKQSCYCILAFGAFQMIMFVCGWEKFVFSAAFGAIQAAFFMLIAHFAQKEDNSYGSVIY